jgi:hypothetical protein
MAFGAMSRQQRTRTSELGGVCCGASQHYEIMHLHEGRVTQISTPNATQTLAQKFNKVPLALAAATVAVPILPSR